MLKFLRRRINKPLDALAKLWQVLRRAIPRWAIELATQQPHKITTATKITSVFSDACPTGLAGVIVLPDGRFFVVARATSKAEQRLSINLLETLAARWVLSQISDDQAENIHLFIDNTTAIAWTTNAVPRSYLAAKMAEELRGLPIYQKITSFSYIRSEDNLADGPSRWWCGVRSPTEQ